MKSEVLPDDVIIAIATQIKRLSPSPATLRAFNLVDKRFHTLSRQILYGNIYLATTTINHFTNSFTASKYAHCIRSLSLCIQQPDRLGSLPAGVQASTVIRDIARLLSLINQMTNLSSFSLIVEPTAGIDIPRATIIQLLMSLPQSCTNLELDTPHYHREQNISEYGDIHMCGHVRRVLPRMQHVRLRLGAMCSEMFEQGDPSAKKEYQARDEGEKPMSRYISLPNLKSLLINTAIGPNQIPGCIERNNITGTSYHHGSSDTAFESISAALSTLISQHSVSDSKNKNLPPNAQILVFHYAIKSTDQTHASPTALLVNMLSKTCTAMPFFRLGNPFHSPSRYLLRLSSSPSREIVLPDSSIGPFAESQLWRPCVGGYRLPAEILEDEMNGRPSFATGCVEQSLEYETMEEWIEENGTQSMWVCYRNEERVGRWLIVPEERTGSDYLSVRPVSEEVPEGWVRTRQGVLERVGDTV